VPAYAYRKPLLELYARAFAPLGKVPTWVGVKSDGEIVSGDS
jgi:hypothetical protein